jgi:hypothetical protein
MQKVDVLIKENQRMMVREIIVQLGIGHHAVQEMIMTSEYWELCSHWIPYMHMDEHKDTHMVVSSLLL